MRDNTYRWHEKHIRLRIVPGLGPLRITKLTDVHVEKFYADLREAGTSDMTTSNTCRTLYFTLEWEEDANVQ